jgi:hypothetical protein
MRAPKENKNGLSLKEEVGQMLSDCPTTSNNRNVDSIIICSGGFAIPLRFLTGGLKAKQRSFLLLF